MLEQYVFSIMQDNNMLIIEWYKFLWQANKNMFHFKWDLCEIFSLSFMQVTLECAAICIIAILVSIIQTLKRLR